MSNALFVFLGSGIGGVCRYLLSQLNTTHPIGTFAANIIGCFIIGLLTKIAPGDAHIRLLLMTGFCGGFTTFSTFTIENLMMLRGGQLLLAIAYIVLSIAIGLLAAYIGYNIKN